MDPQAKALISPLSRTITHQGRALEICIRSDSGGWHLEVFDESDSASVWIESFNTEQAALDEALKTIAENDYDEFTMPRPPYTNEPQWLTKLRES